MKKGTVDLTWPDLLKMGFAVGVGLFLYVAVAIVKSCTAPAMPTTCYVEVFAGKMYLRSHNPANNGDTWGPVLVDIREAPEAAKILGCPLTSGPQP